MNIQLSHTLNTKQGEEQKADLYMRVFWEAPWNEGFECPKSKRLYPLSSAISECGCCDPAQEVKPYYEKDTLNSTFAVLEKKAGYRETIAKVLDKQDTEHAVGFMWGWNTDLSTLNTDKLQLTESQLDELRASIKLNTHNFSFDQFYYFAEIGVDSEMRGLDVAGQLYRAQIQALLECNTKDIIVRTTMKTKLPYEWFLKMGYIPVFEYNDEQDRVILVKQYD